jgi:hypothetical protein
MSDTAADHAQHVMGLITGHWVAAAVHAAAIMGIPDQLADGPHTANELAARVDADPRSTYRVLRALAMVGLFVQRDDGKFALTGSGELLRSDVPGSMCGMAQFQGNNAHWAAWGNFMHSVRTGEPAFHALHGKDFFEYCKTDRALFEAFNAAMTGYSKATGLAVTETYDFSGIRRLIDVGGGHGFMLSTILAANPEMTGCVFDLPSVVAGADAVFTEAGVADRAEAVGGDFFKSVPKGDGYISKHILHDWNDEACVGILRSITTAMDGTGPVLIVENVLPEGDAPSFGKILDLEMLNSTEGGQERTEAEFAALFEQVGLKLSRVIPTPSPVSILEAHRV